MEKTNKFTSQENDEQSNDNQNFNQSEGPYENSKQQDDENQS